MFNLSFLFLLIPLPQKKGIKKHIIVATKSIFQLFKSTSLIKIKKRGKQNSK